LKEVNAYTNRVFVLMRMNDGAHEQRIELELRPPTSVHADWLKHDEMERARYAGMILCVHLIYKQMKNMMLTDSIV
jgi:hypothetical protein